MKLNLINYLSKNLKKISLLIFILGIFLLLIISNIQKINHFTLNEINNNLINRKVQVSGYIYDIKTYEKSNFQIIYLKDSTEQIEITSALTNLKKGQNITTIGRVTEYNGCLQIQADKIILN